MGVVLCLVILACIAAASPAWAADQYPFPVLADPELAFRTPGGESPAVSAIESSSVGRPGSLVSGTGDGPQLLDRTPVTLHYPPPMQVAQAAGTSSPTPTTLGAAGSNPWIFGVTLYGWIPFASSTSTIDGLPKSDRKWPKTDITLTNLYAGAGEFQFTKGDWGLFANVSGASIGLKGVILREDQTHFTREDRSGYSYSSVVDGQYGLSYRVIGRPLDLAAWARERQPVALDLMAGGQTIYVSQSFSSSREHVSVSTTLTSPLLATRLSWDMADRWNLGVGGNIGGFGVSDTNLTWQADLTVSYRFHISTLPSAVALGFRVQGMNFETGAGQHFLKVNELLFGPLFGFSMYF